MRFGAWLWAGLFGLCACVEPARSADTPPPFQPSIAAGSSAQKPFQNNSKQPPQYKSKEAQQALLADISPSEDTKRQDAEPQAAGHQDAAPQPAEPAREQGDRFFDEPDAPVREALSTRNIVRIEKGRGGRSLGFRITLEGGQKGYFKGEQTFSAANWFGEVAAYHLDRMLGLGRAPIVISRQLPWAQLEPVAGRDPRRREIIVRNGQVRGAFVGWVTGSLQPLAHVQGWERWIRVHYWPTTAVTPFQRPAVWKHELDERRRLGDQFRSKDERYRRRILNPAPDREDRPAELSDLITFDYLTRNIDRWGGENANVLVRGDKGPLVFLDNGASFEQGEPRPSLMEARLHALQRFRRRTIQAVRAFDLKKFEARLSQEPVQPVLSRSQLDALEQRRKALLEWVAEMERTHGEAIWGWE